MGNTYNYRLLARIVIETITPVAIGSGNKDIKTDMAVVKDVNGLPFIPGTTLAGLIRHTLSKEEQEKWMGFQKKDEGEGSRLIITEAKLISMQGKPIDGLQYPCDDSTNFYNELPIRQHVRINHKGTTEETGKFDEEIVPKGSRFCFEIELLAEEGKMSEAFFYLLLDNIQLDNFRIGNGSRSGFGAIKVINIQKRMLDISHPEQLELYLNKSSRLDEEWEGFITHPLTPKQSLDFVNYILDLHPIDSLFFGSGFGNESVDMTFVREPAIRWKENQAEIVKTEHSVLIPASSVKGALAHRTAFHYNKLRGVYADRLTSDELQQHTGAMNIAVKTLFGSEGDNNGTGKQRGNVLFSDVLLEFEKPFNGKMINHVKIDDFTGGAITGALFSEEVAYMPERKIQMDIKVAKHALTDTIIATAFEQALRDICSGALPLGGGVNRGNGKFNGQLIKDGELIYE